MHKTKHDNKKHFFKKSTMFYIVIALNSDSDKKEVG